MRDSAMGVRVYSDFWNKYRPVVLKLMIDSEKEDQQYQFLRHELHDVTPTKKSGYSFKLQVFKGRALNNIKTSDLAKDLVVILQRSNKASELLESFTFNFTLDKHFILTVNREEKEEENVEETSDAEVVVSSENESAKVEESATAEVVKEET